MEDDEQTEKAEQEILELLRGEDAMEFDLSIRPEADIGSSALT